MMMLRLSITLSMNMNLVTDTLVLYSSSTLIHNAPIA